MQDISRQYYTVSSLLVVETEKVSWISFREQDVELAGGLAGNYEVILIYVATVAFKCCQVVLLKSEKDFKRRIGLNMRIQCYEFKPQ